MAWFRLVVCLILVAACGAEEDGAQSTSSQPAASTKPPPTSQMSTTLGRTTSTAAATTTTIAFQLVLTSDGLGDLEFGEPTASAMQVLVALLGPPDPGEEYPYGGHPLRHVYWESVGLAAVFSDYDFYRDDGEEHFAAWTHGEYIGDLAGWDHGPSSLPLKTAKGIGIHSTLADLQTAYTDQVQLEAECDPDGPPTAAYVPGRVSSIRFYFQDLPLEAASRIGSISAGAGRGC